MTENIYQENSAQNYIAQILLVILLEVWGAVSWQECVTGRERGAGLIYANSLTHNPEVNF